MKSITRRDLIKRLDKLVQTVARYDGAKKKKGVWYNTCISCGKIGVVGKNIQGGHLWGRSCFPLRWQPEQVRPQCAHCNCFLHGNEREYAKAFILKYGEELYQSFDIVAKNWREGKTKAFSMDDLKEMHDYRLEIGRELERKTGLKLFPKGWVKLVHMDIIDM